MSPLTVNEDAVMSMQTDIDPGLKRWSDIGFAITERLLRLAPTHSREAGAAPVASNPGVGNIRSLGKNWVY